MMTKINHDTLMLTKYHRTETILSVLMSRSRLSGHQKEIHLPAGKHDQLFRTYKISLPTPDTPGKGGGADKIEQDIKDEHMLQHHSNKSRGILHTHVTHTHIQRE